MIYVGFKAKYSSEFYELKMGWFIYKKAGDFVDLLKHIEKNNKELNFMSIKELKRVCVKPFDKDRFEVIKDYDFNFFIVLRNNKVKISGRIKAGYKTDGASIPRLFWSIYPPFKSEYFSACVIHDFLCDEAKKIDNLCLQKLAYKNADLALKQALKELKINPFKVFIFYHSCNAFHTLKYFLKGVFR